MPSKAASSAGEVTALLESLAEQQVRVDRVGVDRERATSGNNRVIETAQILVGDAGIVVREREVGIDLDRLGVARDGGLMVASRPQ